MSKWIGVDCTAWVDKQQDVSVMEVFCHCWKLQTRYTLAASSSNKVITQGRQYCCTAHEQTQSKTLPFNESTYSLYIGYTHILYIII